MEHNNRKKMVRGLTVIFAAIAVLFSHQAMAHSVGGPAAGFAAGFSHPWAGLDHLMAMIALGVWATQIGRPALWVLPLVFPAVMACGAALAVGGVWLPGVEAGTAASVLALGLVIALAMRPPLPVAGAFAGAFALLHGQVHGGELPAGASASAYGIGFVLSTLMLHGIGLVLGLASRMPARSSALRVAGAAVGVLGAVFLFAL